VNLKNYEVTLFAYTYINKIRGKILIAMPENPIVAVAV